MVPAKSFRIITFGCKVNQYESELLREELIQRGMMEADKQSGADFFIINTCTVTAGADAKCRKTIRQIGRENPDASIVVTGCYAEREREFLSNLPNVIAVADNSEKNGMAGILTSTAEDNILSGISSFESRTRAFVKIQDGCSEFCAYCIIPYVRGQPRWRNADEIVTEVTQLVSNGYREIVLTGIHLGCYGRTQDRVHALDDLIHRLNNIDGLQRLRLSSIDPQEVNNELIKSIGDTAIACKHLHISLQSGSTRILKLMGRKYSSEYYLRLCERLYKHYPDMSISTDIMTGFPGETEEDFLASCRVVEHIRFSKVHIFPFSPREGTRAAKMPEQVDSQTAHERGARLAVISSESAKKHRSKFKDRHMEILIEGETEGKNVFEGFTDNYLRTIVKSGRNLKSNDLVSAVIEDYDDRLQYARIDSE